ncbi:hypothetical protein DACRYDRAFT_100134 [Dacryopinax primogenitus]|uniref:Urea transporter n=1 Tax=Dacryopinax primogenitus (strain DJM 731) TaxID=1858805 RepID=M5G7I9_DACPD|nr:uncharacterized protein DACRYDRAFT_100134 [Dacryopinax primogenitus]EJU01842.1 hypothetical protein DACRYDRAFT_100134 [Dacryopinax primogenitus]
MAWFSIPFGPATTLGLAAVALRGDPDMRSLSAADVSAGLPAPTAAAALLGPGGAAAVLVLLFLAVTSATSAELIAVSSLLTYDVYKRYINPHATEKQILNMSHLMVVLYAVVMGFCGLIFYYIGISMGWLYLFMGAMLGSAVVPIAMCITWSKANKTGCMVGAVLGLILGIISWLVTTAKLNNNVINVVTTGGNYPMLTGNLVSIAVGGLVSLVWSLIWPENFDFDITRAINCPEPCGTASTDEAENEGPFPEKSKEGESRQKALQVEEEQAYETAQNTGITGAAELNRAGLAKAYRFATWSSVILTLVLVIIIPMSLFGSSIVYSVNGFGAWVIIGFVWAFLAAFIVVLYPLWESRGGLAMVARGIIKDIYKPGSGLYVDTAERQPSA